MTYQQASARVLDRIRLNNRRRNHLVANPDDAEFERSDERDDELAAEQAAGDAAANDIVLEAIPETHSNHHICFNSPTWCAVTLSLRWDLNDRELQRPCFKDREL